MTPTSTVRVISASDTQQALPMSDAVEIMKSAYAALSQGEAVLPLRTPIEIPQHHGTALFMPSYLPSLDRLGLKVVTLFDNNSERGLPRLQSIVLLLDGTTGVPLAVLDGATLTAIRTGAGAGAATDLLARKNATVATIFGAGVQGRTQLEAVCCVRTIRQAWVVDPNLEAARQFAEQMTERLKCTVVVATDPAEAVRQADIICTATVSGTPVFNDQHVGPGTHINAIGSYKPHVQEIPAATVARATIVVDHRASAMDEAGDLIVPLQQGLISEQQLQVELGDIVCGRQPGRTNDHDITFFKSVGVGIQDLTAATFVYDRALQLGLGVEAPL